MKTLLSKKSIKTHLLATATLLLSCCALLPSAQANLLLNVDLSVENTITVSTTDGSSLISESGSLFRGMYLDGFFGDIFSSSISDSLISGGITSINDTSDVFNDLFHSSNDPGLNLFNLVGGTATFTAGELAFEGQASWAVSDVAYQSALNGALSGGLFFPADTIDDIDGLSALGTWAVSGVDNVEVPAPSALVLLAFGLAGVSLSRKSKVLN